MQKKKASKNKSRIIIILFTIIIVSTGLSVWCIYRQKDKTETGQMFQLSEEEMEDFVKEQEDQGNTVEIRDDIEH
jgi:flagellar basal body-associated protein FliL